MKTSYIDVKRVVIINYVVNVIKTNVEINLYLIYKYTLCSIIFVTPK